MCIPQYGVHSTGYTYSSVQIRVPHSTWCVYTTICGTHIPQYRVHIFKRADTCSSQYLVCVHHNMWHTYPTVQGMCIPQYITSRYLVCVFHSAGYVHLNAIGTCIPQYEAHVSHSMCALYCGICIPLYCEILVYVYLNVVGTCTCISQYTGMCIPQWEVPTTLRDTYPVRLDVCSVLCTPYCGIHVPCTVRYVCPTLQDIVGEIHVHVHVHVPCTLGYVFPVGRRIPQYGVWVPHNMGYAYPTVRGMCTTHYGVCAPHCKGYIYFTMCTVQNMARVSHSMPYVYPNVIGTCTCTCISLYRFTCIPQNGAYVFLTKGRGTQYRAHIHVSSTVGYVCLGLWDTCTTYCGIHVPSTVMYTYLVLLGMCTLFYVPHTVGYVCLVMWDVCASYSGIHVPHTVGYTY